MILFRMKNPVTNEITYSILKIKLRIILFIIYTLSEKKKNILISAIKLFNTTLKLFHEKQNIYKHLFVNINILKKLIFNRIILQIYNNKI